jgi:hypothetical protein
MKKDRKEALTFNKAVEMLHRTGTRMMIMHGSDGDHFYIVPGGGRRSRARHKRYCSVRIFRSSTMVFFPAILSRGRWLDDQRSINRPQRRAEENAN